MRYPMSNLDTAKLCQMGGRRGIKNKETHVESGSKKRRNEVQTVQTTISSYFGKKETEGGKQQGRDSKEKEKRLHVLRRPSERDTGSYREGYPGKKDDHRLNANLEFYTRKIPSSPDGDFIDIIHKKWWGNYNLLESHHGYIQWIFPIREKGLNWQAQALQKHEAEEIKANPEAHARVLTSYKMMLDFYGMRLVNKRTGKLARTDNYEERFDNLNWSSHNYLRITRILKSLGEFGYEHLKKGFIQFVLEEALIHKTLKRTLTSCRDYWIGTIREKKDRDELHQYIRDNID